MCDQLLDESNAAAGGLGLRVGVGAGGIGALSAAVTGGMGGGAAGTAAASAGGTMSAASVLYLDDRTLAEQQLQKAQRRRQRRQEEEEGKAEIIAANAELRRKLNNNNSNNHNNDGGDTDANAAEPSEAEMASYLETNRACLQSCHTLNSLPLGQMLRTPPTTPGVTTSQQQQPQPSLVDRRAQALCSYPESDFSNVLSLFHDTVLKQLKGSGATPKSSAAGGAGGFETPGSGTGTGTAASGAGGAPVRRPRVPMPIVVVPSALTSMITLANAQSLLADSVYIDANTARLQHQSSAEGSSQGVTASASPKPLSDFVIMTTKLGTAHPIPVRFVDKPTKLTEAEWRHQVVAVFATGQRWQFKDFCPHLPGLFPHAPVDLFQQVLGVHLMYDEKTIDPVVSSWNCAVLKISRNRRHQDAVAANMFWSLLTEHIKLKRPWLLEPPATTATGAASAVSSSHKKH